jgi:hypothetical protein
MLSGEESQKPDIPGFAVPASPQIGDRVVPLERYVAALSQCLRSEDEILFRLLGKNGAELVVGLKRALRPESLRLLAEHKDRAGPIERAWAAELQTSAILQLHESDNANFL